MADSLSFPDWLRSQLEERDWRQADLARRARIDTGLLSRIISGERLPSREVCVSISRAMDIPEQEVYRRAGLLSEKTALTERAERVMHLLGDLTDDDVQFLEQWARLRVEWHRRGGGDSKRTAKRDATKESQGG